MVATAGQNWQNVQESALPVIGKAARSTDEAIIAALDAQGDTPMRMYGAIVPDTKLYFSASRPLAGNGSKVVKPAIDDKMPDVAASSLDLSTAATTGGTFQKDGSTFSIPTGTISQFIRMVTALRSTGEINVHFSAQAASVGALDLPETLLSGLDGDPIGWVDLQYATTSTLKTANSVTTVIENAVSSTAKIFNVAGGGAGGGADRTYKITSFSSTGFVLKGGYAWVEGVGILSSGTGLTTLLAGADQTINGNNVLAQSTGLGFSTITGAATAASRLYSLVIDLNTLSTTKSQISTSLRNIYTWVEANLKFINSDPESIDPRRYVFLDQVYIPISSTTWTSTGVLGIVKPARNHNTLAAFFPYAENYAPQLTTAAAGVQTLTHNLTGEPQLVMAYYYDGTNKNRLDDQSVIVTKSATQIKVNTDAYDLTGGKYVEIQAIYIPGMKAVAGSSRTFTSGWMTSTATTTLPHGLNDREDIRGYAVQHWNTSTGKVRNVDPSGLVLNFDDTNFNLDWTGLNPQPSATHNYRVVAGGSPLPWAVPSDLGGFTKYVKHGPGSYATVFAALAASASGDRICIYGNTVETASIVVPAGVELFQMPGTQVVLSGTVNIQFSGAKGVWKGMNVQSVPVGTLASVVAITAADCIVEGWIETNAAQTFTAVVATSALGVRASYAIGVLRTLGTITALEDNLDGAGKPQIWGG